MSRKIDTVIVGGGQAGLAVSYYLKQDGREHVVVEQAPAIANAWRNHRWDSFTLNTPNWQSCLPGAECPGVDPDGFLSRDEIVAYFQNYVDRFDLPVLYGVEVKAIEPNDVAGYVVETSAGRFVANNVVIATGLYQKPKVPVLSADFPADVTQFHSDKYRNPQLLPAGSVLVVGSAQSGTQIAEELNQSGRKVYLSVSRAGRVPRRYRGKDANWWQDKMGAYDRTVDQLPSPQAKFASKPHISGKDGGHTINLHQFSRDGVILLGRIRQVKDGRIILAPDLKDNLAKADQFEADFVKRVDEFIAKTGIDVPQEVLPDLRNGYDVDELSQLGLADANITSVIWATGYTFDFGLVHMPIFDSDGFPIQKRGVTAHPGLYFAGLPWLHNAKSGLLFGASQDAAYIATRIADDTMTSSELQGQRSVRPSRNLEFDGKVALITGGTSGIGAATAIRVAELGASVVITGRRRRQGQSVVNEIVRNGGRAAFLQADVSKPEEARRIVPFVVETFGRLDYAFNNAATSGNHGLLVDQTEENFDQVFAVNVKGLFVLLQQELKQMLFQGQGGSIVNAASVGGLVATPAAGPYVASKHAVLGLTKSAAVEYGRYGIRVNAVSPGAVRTEMLLQVFGSEEALDRMSTVHPIGRIGRPEEIANSVVWLFSDKSSYYTGQSLILDGGLTAQRPYPETANIHGGLATKDKSAEWTDAIPSPGLPGSASTAFGHYEFVAGD
jgi:putative flavoprotein involved in K+ transport